MIAARLSVISDPRWKFSGRIKRRDVAACHTDGRRVDAPCQLSINAWLPGRRRTRTTSMTWTCCGTGRCQSARRPGQGPGWGDRLLPKLTARVRFPSPLSSHQASSGPDSWPLPPGRRLRLTPRRADCVRRAVGPWCYAPAGFFPGCWPYLLCVWSVGRAPRRVVGYVGGPVPAGVRVVLLIRVEPVVAPVGSWLAAHGAWCDIRALARSAIGLCPPDPNPDHHRECGDVKQRHENDHGGQTAAHLISSRAWYNLSPSRFRRAARHDLCHKPLSFGQGEAVHPELERHRSGAATVMHITRSRTNPQAPAIGQAPAAATARLCRISPHWHETGPCQARGSEPWPLNAGEGSAMCCMCGAGASQRGTRHRAPAPDLDTASTGPKGVGDGRRHASPSLPAPDDPCQPNRHANHQTSSAGQRSSRPSFVPTGAPRSGACIS